MVPSHYLTALVFVVSVTLSATHSIAQEKPPSELQKEIQSLRQETERLKKEGESLRTENQVLRKLLAERQAAPAQPRLEASVTAPARTAPLVTPSTGIQPAKGTLTNWLTTSSSKRHNSSCRYYMNSKGRPCRADEGIACKICGG